MAMMSDVQLLLPILASLFLLPALCGAVHFQQCNVYEPNPVFVFGIQVSQPRPGQLTIIIAGTTRVLIEGRKTFIYVTLKTPNEGDLVLETYRLCYTTQFCNSEGHVVAGTTFILGLAEVHYDSGSQQGTLSLSARNNATEPPKEFFCVDLEYPESSAHKLASA